MPTPAAIPVTAAVILCRQSLTTDDSLSLDGQEIALRSWLGEQGIAVAGVIRAASTRGWKEERADLAEVIAGAERGDYNGLAIWALDRLARKVRIQENTIYELEQRGVVVLSRQEPWVNDPTMRQVVGALNERFTRELSARMKHVAAMHHASGVPHFDAPYGFRKYDRTFHPVPEEIEIVRLIHARYAAGMGSSAIAHELMTMGVPPPGARTKGGSVGWRHDVILRIIGNPVYQGVQRMHGEDRPGNWAAVIDHDLWATAAAVRAAGRNPRTPLAQQSWCQGLVLHACGAKAYLSGRATWRYYTCSHASRQHAAKCALRPHAMGQAKLERLAWARIVADLDTLLDPAEARRRVIAALLAAAPDAERERRKLTRERADLERRRDRVREWYLAGKESLPWANDETAALDARLAAIDTSLTARPEPPDLARMRTAVDHLRTIRDAIADALPDAPADRRRVYLLALDARIVFGHEGVAVAYPERISQLLDR